MLIFCNFGYLYLSTRRIIKHNITNTRYYVLEKKKKLMHCHDRRAREFYTGRAELF